MKRMIIIVAFLECFFFLDCKAFAGSNTGDSLRVSSVLQSHMVIQRNKPFKVWGKGTAGEAVRIKADWMAAPVQVSVDKNGTFEGIINVPDVRAGDYRPHTLSISSRDRRIVLSDLLIGDLWFLSGQSNMQFAVREMLDSTKVIAGADNPRIRLLNVALNFSARPADHIRGEWEICTPSTVRGFSAVGYSFGAALQRALDIPIGLIFSGIGASAVQAFIPEKTLKKDSLLNRVYLQPYLRDPRSREVIDAGFSFEKVTRPFLLYNAMIHPFTRLSIKGFCWYQGETNYKERESYTRATIEMIKSWRDSFGQGPLPFEFVQIAPYAHEKMDPALCGDAFFREAQEKISRLNNTDMVVTMDVGNAQNLHPKDKALVGLRLAKVALNRTYGRLDIPYRGPQFAYAAFKGRGAVVHFDKRTLSGGLRTKDGKAPGFFFLAGKDRIFYPAEATIAGDSVILHADKVERPLAVRYGFFNYPVTNLQNGAGFPAVPFRSDSWPEQPEK